ncbi:MAG TPA: hypothetical protein VGA64_12240 [Candidatus Polarisedimenticolia bacterium]
MRNQAPSIPGSSPGPAGRRLTALVLAALVIASGTPCCVTPSGSSDLQSSPGALAGYRALFKVVTDGPRGRAHFRMAAALLPPERLRLEFFGPVGGPRLIVAVDGAEVLAIIPGERRYDAAPASAETLDRILGLPLNAPQVIALLSGRPMCSSETAEQQVQTKLAATFGRTLAWVEVTCPPDDIRYEARCQDRGGILREASVREGLTGAMILQVQYEDHETGAGPRWPRRIRMKLARDNTRIDLEAVEGPVVSPTSPAIFAPPVPEGFEKRSLLASPTAPGLLGSTSDREK